MKRVLVTGSRDWSDESVISSVLKRVFDHYGRFRLVHGGAIGADQIAGRVMRQRDFGPQEVHPAQWGKHEGKTGGHERNAFMVGLGADLCLAFILNHSKGASGCAALAEEAGIPTRRIHLNG